MLSSTRTCSVHNCHRDLIFLWFFLSHSEKVHVWGSNLLKSNLDAATLALVAFESAPYNAFK
jgi:hypothetical protein